MAWHPLASTAHPCTYADWTLLSRRTLDPPATMGADPPTPEHTLLRYDDNLPNERPTFVPHLECAYTGERHAADEVHNLSRAGKPLLVRYDLAGVRGALSKAELERRPPDRSR